MTTGRDSFLSKVAWPLLILALTPAATLVGSRIVAGDWVAWAKDIPSWVYSGFFALLFLWLVVGSIVRRVRHLKVRNLPSLPEIISISRWGYVTIGITTHKRVVWRIQVPAPAPWHGFALTEARTARVDVATPPRCPACDIEIEEAETFLGSYRWYCLRCTFATKNDISFHHEAVRVQKLAQAEVEKLPEAE